MDVLSYFKQAIDKRASDLHLVAGSAPSLRIAGELIKIDQTVVNAQALEGAINSILDESIKERFKRKREIDFSQDISGARFRINLHYQEGKIGLTARLVPQDVPRPEEIGLTETIYRLTHLRDGLILVTGPSGSGKSTTLATMIDMINKERRAHIITIEDPIEYLFKETQSIIEQREIGYDTKSFASALKYALRQDPNVIMVGEMRDPETISATLTAAETGHLVLSTLHTATAPETIERIIDAFPAHQEQQVLNQLAANLRAVIAQQLLPTTKGGLVAAREILINNQAISNLIKSNQIAQIPNVIQTSYREGMISMNKSIEKLVKEGSVDRAVASRYIRDLETKATYY